MALDAIAVDVEALLAVRDETSGEMDRVEGFAAAGLPADYRHASLWKHAFDKSWRWCCQPLTQPLGLRQRFALCLGSRCEFFFGLRDLSFGICPRIALVVDVLRNPVTAIKECRDDRAGRRSAPQHLVDHPPHCAGAITTKLSAFTVA